MKISTNHILLGFCVLCITLVLMSAIGIRVAGPTDSCKEASEMLSITWDRLKVIQDYNVSNNTELEDIKNDLNEHANNIRVELGLSQE